jgi:putative glycosyltransferase (TIGR04348 family)
MRVTIITPARPGSSGGNRTTAERWAEFLRQAGHSVAVEREWSGEPAELMVALHARHSHHSIERYAESLPGHPLVVVLTGTDLYRDIRTDPDARESLDLATHLVVLQEAGLDELPEHHRLKTRVIYQSAEPTPRIPTPGRYFEVCVVGHLRAEKDPFCAARAARLLPASSRIRITQAGRALDAEHARRARELSLHEPRYRWLGEIPQEEVRRLMARSRLLVQSSFMEGGANAVSEALAAGLPVLASRISGNVGMLGEDYPGYYPAGDEHTLADLLYRAESDEGFYRALEEGCEASRHLVLPERERAAIEELVRELCPTTSGDLDYTRGVMDERTRIRLTRYSTKAG